MEEGSSGAESLYDESFDAHRWPSSSSDGDDTNGAGAHPARYAFAQAFGERAGDPACHFDVQDADIISSVRFSERADMIATGDKGGRIVLLRRVAPRRRRRSLRASASSYGEDEEDVAVEERGESPEYRFWTQFQSHEPEFDYLKSTEIEEKINEIRWCRGVNGAQRLLATNDKTIKLWRVFEKEVKHVVSLTPRPRTTAAVGRSSPRARAQQGDIPWGFGACMPHMYNSKRGEGEDKGGGGDFAELRSKYAKLDASALVLPKVRSRGNVISATPRRVYSNSHAYHINSISLSSDEETFLSADDLRINVWNLHKGGAGFNVVDIKPDNMDDLTEVITSAEFHPHHCHLFMHSSSRGSVKLCDLRDTALCDASSKEFEERADRSSRSSFFSEIIASISDIKFSPCGRYILTRDYMTLRLWDVNMERQPVLVVPVHEHLRPRLGEMYESDAIFDKFGCAFSHDGRSLLTGSYRSRFQSFSAYHGGGVAVEATVDFVSGLSGRGSLYASDAARAMVGAPSSRFVDTSRKIVQLDAARREGVAAAAAGAALYVYHVPRNK